MADAKGQVLAVKGDRKVMAMAEQNFYIPGCIRSTENAGTNGIGLCLEEGKAIQLTGAEHFNLYHHPWTCSSAPIKDVQERLLGALTLSGPSIGRHQHTLALVTSAAKTIEMQLRERSLVERTQRLNIMLTSIYNSVTDGFIATDNNKIITHLNQTASRMLGVKPDSLTGQGIENLIQSGLTTDNWFDSGEPIEPTEVTFLCPDGARNYMARVDPIRNASFKILGSIMTISEKSRLLNLAKKLGGNYAKYEFNDIKGKSSKFTKQIETAKIAAKTNSRVLIIGASGTGKELFAQAIHNHSNRKKGPFVAISCPAIPRDLIESELFGYIGGAFTGARQKGMIGKFELANKGTLFLDEINCLPLDLQVKILRVLQQNEIMRIGDARTIPIDVRIIAASNTDLMEEVEQGDFRKDLYYRLSVIEIFLPLLKDRPKDIELLFQHILDRRCSEAGIQKPRLDKKVFETLKKYPWPGNIRELENVAERALLLSQGETIHKEHLPLRTTKTARAGRNRLGSLKNGYKEMIETTLEECDGNLSQAARELKIARSTLYRKLQEFGIRTT
ncbi:MAG: sigma 54-interacting transcriptional regulator [Desulfohalobiaceae bacterium]|nr:sigma 54-interacting transcriptional regulator [Desulfohalobiaceae bacterium]